MFFFPKVYWSVFLLLKLFFHAQMSVLFFMGSAMRMDSPQSVQNSLWALLLRLS